MMLFSVVQERKNLRAKAILSVVPTKWIQGKKVYWPQMNLVESMQRDPDSVPDFKSWKQHSYESIIGARNTFEEADKLLDEYINLTDPEKENSSRRVTCGRGGKFISSTYLLKQPLKQSASKNFRPEEKNHLESIPKHLESASTSTTTVLADVANELSESNFLSTCMGQDSTKTDSWYANSTQISVQLDESGRFLSYAPYEAHPANNISSDATVGLNNTTTSALNDLTVGSNWSHTLANATLRLEEKIDAQNLLLGQIKQTVDVNTDKISKCLKFIVNTEKFMQLLPKQGVHQNLSNISEVQEDFIEFTSLKPASTQEELLDLERKVSDDAYKAKFFRYLKTIKKLDGKGQGRVIFRELVRSLLLPDAIMNYSWIGKDSNLESFHTTFPCLIDFIHMVVREGDSSYVLEQTINAFKVFLRNKNTEAKRNANRKAGERCSTYTRKNKSKGNNQHASMNIKKTRILSYEDGELTNEAEDGSEGNQNQ